MLGAHAGCGKHVGVTSSTRRYACSILRPRRYSIWRFIAPMRATLRKLSIVLPVGLLFSVACWGQTTAFQGDVKGEDGKPLKDALIKIERTDIKGNYKVKSDKK